MGESDYTHKTLNHDHHAHSCLKQNLTLRATVGEEMRVKHTDECARAAAVRLIGYGNDTTTISCPL